MNWIELEMFERPLGYAVLKEVSDKGKIKLVVGEFDESGFLALNYDDSWAFEFQPFWKYYYIPLELK